MATESYFFFDSRTGDRRIYPASTFADMMSALASNGVFRVGSMLEVTKGSAPLTTQITDGKAIVLGRVYTLFGGETAPFVIQHPSAITFRRIDRIVLRLNLIPEDNGRWIRLMNLLGTEGNEPVPPALTRTDDVYDICLAEVTLTPGKAELDASDIKDTRDDETLCGWANFAPNPPPDMSEIMRILDAINGEVV